MALGGGTFVTQNKILPGAYINFVSLASASATLSDRGTVTMPLMLDWGNESGVFEVTNGDFQKSTMKLFGYTYTDDKMKGLRDLFKKAKTLYAYRLNGGGKKASNTFATAKYSGTRGNDLKIVIQKNADNDSLFDVSTYMGLLNLLTWCMRRRRMLEVLLTKWLTLLPALATTQEMRLVVQKRLLLLPI